MRNPTILGVTFMIPFAKALARMLVGANLLSPEHNRLLRMTQNAVCVDRILN